MSTSAREVIESAEKFREGCGGMDEPLDMAQIVRGMCVVFGLNEAETEYAVAVYKRLESFRYCYSTRIREEFYREHPEERGRAISVRDNFRAQARILDRIYTSGLNILAYPPKRGAND